MSQFYEASPTGTIDGTNTVFYLPVNPTSVEVYLNGLLQEDSGGDFTRTGMMIVYVIPPLITDALTAWVFRS